MERMPSTNDCGADGVVDRGSVGDRGAVSTGRPKDQAVADPRGWSP